MDAAGDGEVKCMWKPNPNKCTNAAMFRQRINDKFNTNLTNYHDLYNWSVQNYAEFWGELWQSADVKHSQTYNEVIDKSKTIDDIPEWFEGSRLNYAENMLKFDDDRPAVYIAREGENDIKKYSFTELRKLVARYAAAMRKMGIRTGDRVVGYIPNCVEALAAMLAVSSIGAIWSSTSPDFGVTGVLDRFSQIEPRLIFSVNAVRYNGKVHNHLEKLKAVAQSLRDLEKVVVIPYVTENGDKIDLSDIRNGCLLEEFLSSGTSDKGSVPELVFEQLPFNHPLFIMYSSGTTGAPKCMIHSQGGTLMKHLEEHVLQGGITRDDIVMYYTTTGWMMWNWFVSALAVGAAIVCYDGSPLIPDHNILWDLVDKIKITVLGTGAKWLSVLEERGVKPGKSHKLTSLHTILSTGSPLKPQSYEYVYRDIKNDLLLGSITGGTDILGCFAAQTTDLPVHCGEIQCRVLGMGMESWDEDGKPIVGESGELVCTVPFPSMPTHFWRDEDGAKYKKAYFDKFDGIWAHGDYCMISAQTQGIWMLGRSDGTLNPNGVRFGSAEIYRVVEDFPEVADSLCVSQRSQDLTEERVVLFLQMAPGNEFSADLVKKVKAKIRAQLSARHVPGVVLKTTDIPYTHSGKKVEVAVKKILAGGDVRIRGAYSNPDSLDLYYNLPQLQGY